MSGCHNMDLTIDFENTLTITLDNFFAADVQTRSDFHYCREHDQAIPDITSRRISLTFQPGTKQFTFQFLMYQYKFLNDKKNLIKKRIHDSRFTFHGYNWNFACYERKIHSNLINIKAETARWAPWPGIAWWELRRGHFEVHRACRDRGRQAARSATAYKTYPCLGVIYKLYWMYHWFLFFLTQINLSRRTFTDNYICMCRKDFRCGLVMMRTVLSTIK